ncbi:hypothetical protein TrST_g550 [Triparma strigata]|uniref:Uncharacterized protein n=1 Tax=Triparma strigata TaxID=1606541 RepID=A0A9W7BR61_9STRA|nr:hypothetical protein TrST_g550 [Triparma strigata]
MEWVEYARDQATLAKEIWHDPAVLWTDPDKEEPAGSAGSQATNEDESASEEEIAEKKTTLDYFSNREDAVEAVNKLSYYGLPGTSNSRVRNLIAYIGARHPLLAIFLGSPFDYYTRYRRVAALVGSFALSLTFFLLFSFVNSEFALITCNSGCDLVVPCNRTDLTRQLDAFWEDGSQNMCCQDNCVLWLDANDESHFEFIPDFCQGESYSYDLLGIGIGLEELPPYETHRTEVTVSLFDYSCDGGSQSLATFELLLISTLFYPLDLFLGIIATWGKKNPRLYWNKCTKAVWQFVGASISYCWSLIMLLLALTNVSGSLASENYLPLENEGNSRQTRLFASSFKLLWYMWILWLLKNIPSHCMFYFIKKKHFKEKYPDLVSIEPSEFDKTTTTTTRDDAPSQSSHSQTYELPQVAAIKQQRAFSVTVPPNCPPGTMMMITPPDSQLTFSCQVPHGVKQGDVFQVII